MENLQLSLQEWKHFPFANANSYILSYTRSRLNGCWGFRAGGNYVDEKLEVMLAVAGKGMAASSNLELKTEGKSKNDVSPLDRVHCSAYRFQYLRIAPRIPAASFVIIIILLVILKLKCIANINKYKCLCRICFWEFKSYIIVDWMCHE